MSVRDRLANSMIPRLVVTAAMACITITDHARSAPAERSPYYADREVWIDFAQYSVADKMRRKKGDLKFIEETVYLTQKHESDRDPVIVCGTVEASSGHSTRFISNGDLNGTYLEDRDRRFEDRWQRWCR